MSDCLRLNAGRAVGSKESGGGITEILFITMNDRFGNFYVLIQMVEIKELQVLEVPNRKSLNCTN